MNKWELEQTLNKLEICRDLLVRHIPEIYARETIDECLSAINKVKKDIEKA